MSAAIPDGNSSDAAPWKGGDGGWVVSALIYAAFAVAVFLLQGPRPLLGSDHLSYLQLAERILEACVTGDYWRELSSTTSYGVLLAYLHRWTGDHVLSMKLALAVSSVLYLLAAELFFRLFARSRWRAVLFALLSAFAVSFGVSSWGITDSTALLPRTLVAPLVMLAMWCWFRFDGRPLKYAALPLLVLGSLLHLGAFYVIGVLVLVELWDFVVVRRLRPGRAAAGFLAGLAASGLLLFGLEHAGFSSKMIGIQVPELLRSVGFKVANLDIGPAKAGCTAPSPRLAPPPRPVMPGGALAAKPAAPATPPAAPPAGPSAGPPATAKEAWEIELRLRPWRNMPLPLVNVANILSSSALILLLAAAGVVAARRSGMTRADRMMLAMLFAVPVFALGPQTLLWILRSFTAVYPATIEEIRALGLVMIPALYFILRLFEQVVARGGPRMRLRAAAIVVAVLVLPLAMKGLPRWIREDIFSTMVAIGIIDRANEARVANARTALGLSAAAPFYYSTQGVRQWLERNAPRGARILTDRDDMILLRDKAVVGPRQVGATTYYATDRIADVFLETSRAMAARDLRRLSEIARASGAQYVVVPWPVADAAFADRDFSVVAVRGE